MKNLNKFLCILSLSCLVFFSKPLTAQVTKIGIIHQQVNIGLNNIQLNSLLLENNRSYLAFGLQIAYSFDNTYSLNASIVTNERSFSPVFNDRYNFLPNGGFFNPFGQSSNQYRLAAHLKRKTIQSTIFTLNTLVGIDIVYDDANDLYGIGQTQFDENPDVLAGYSFNEYLYQSINPLATIGFEGVYHLTSWLDLSMTLSYSHALLGPFANQLGEMVEVSNGGFSIPSRPENVIRSARVNQQLYLHSFNTVVGISYKFR